MEQIKNLLLKLWVAMKPWIRRSNINPLILRLRYSLKQKLHIRDLNSTPTIILLYKLHKSQQGEHKVQVHLLILLFLH